VHESLDPTPANFFPLRNIRPVFTLQCQQVGSIGLAAPIPKRPVQKNQSRKTSPEIPSHQNLSRQSCHDKPP
jgi:hypothetical protein